MRVGQELSLQVAAIQSGYGLLMLGSCFRCQTKNDYYRLQGLQPYQTRQAHQIPCGGIVLFQEVPDKKQPRVARSMDRQCQDSGAVPPRHLSTASLLLSIKPISHHTCSKPSGHVYVDHSELTRAGCWNAFPLPHVGLATMLA